MAEPPQSLSAYPTPRELSLRAWAPLREPLFRSLWIAAVISYSGTWMQNLGAGWLMTTMTTSPMMVSLVQAATSLPVFLVVLPAGALADMVDRRRLLLITQAWMVLAAAALGVLTLAGVVTPWMLLLFTFLLGLGAVINDPAWQAIMPEVVSREKLSPALALNSAGFNVARSLGPAAGGLVIAAAGSGTAFLINAASFFGVIVFLFRWKRPPHQDPVPVSRLLESLAAGFRHLRESPPVQSVLVRTGLFSLFASALWALLPLIASPHGAIGFGMLLGAFGVGALLGAAILPVFRHATSLDTIVAGASVLFAAVTAPLGYVDSFPALSAAMFFGGVAWIKILVSLNFSAQTMSPSWMRARSLSMYLLVLQGGMAVGSVLWGAVATRFGITTAFVAAAVGLVAGLAGIHRFRLRAAPVDVSAPLTSPAE